MTYVNKIFVVELHKSHFRPDNESITRMKMLLVRVVQLLKKDLEIQQDVSNSFNSAFNSAKMHEIDQK